jgi:ATP-binding cassette subfamily F protein 3
MLTLSEISKSFAGRTLFEDVTLTLTRDDRVGLVGPNGAGKSTLFSIILGVEPPDEGQVEFLRGLTLGHLPQESAPVGEETVLEIATGVAHALHPDPDPHHHVDGHTEAKAKQILHGLSFRERDFDRPARELSGGWVMRAHLARLLVSEPDLLLLDEPTNHLDLDALLWFQDYLKTYPGAILMISHDREFLNQLITGIVEIRQSRLFRYRGNYDSYLEQRAANEAQLLSAYNNQQREINRLQTFADRFRAKATKASQAQSKLKQIERMEKIEAPQNADATVQFRFPQPARSGQRVIKLERVRFGYGPAPVYESLDFEAERGQRIVLVGPNGAGKSTLLKLLAGVLVPQAGAHTLGHNVKAGYFSQYRTETLRPQLTVLEEAFDTPQRVTETAVRSVLGSFLFRGDDVFKKVSVLSGGEKSRLALVRLLLDPPNLLLMDEPTTHLDLSSVDALLYALDQFAGTLIFISHDVYFIRSLANHVVHVQDGRLKHYTGGYQYFLDKTATLRAGDTSGRDAFFRIPEAALTPKLTAPVTADPYAGVSRKEQKRLEADARQARSRETKAARQRVHELEKAIHAAEARQRELTAQLEDPATYQEPGRAVAINRELQGLHHHLEQVTPDWEAAATELAALETAGE